jgi:hypothetical protein
MAAGKTARPGRKALIKRRASTYTFQSSECFPVRMASHAIQHCVSLASNSWKGAAALALTGDHKFFFDLRRRATTLGMHLNEYGLWKWESTGSDIDDGHWIFVEGSDEEAILKELGMEYVEPTKRNFVNLS